VPEKASIPGELLKFALAAVYGVVLIAVAPPSVWLVLFAHTAVGRGLGVLGLLTIGIAADLFVWFRRPVHKKLWGWGTVLLALAWIGTGAMLLREAPPGEAPPGSPVSHRFTSGGRFDPYCPANVVPEVEQINLALAAAPLIDPILTREQAARLRRVVLPIYDEMERDANFAALGSALGGLYADLLGRPFDTGHYYLYVPRQLPTGPRPAVLFLHGSGGNFKAYTWLWSRLAEREGLIVIAPSFGAGHWDRDAGPAAALRALDDAARHAPIDPGRVYLAGLSNGGVGVCRLAASHPDRFAGLIFLSPVMAPEIVDGKAFAAAWRGRPVLILTGDADRRVPVDSVRQRAAAMQAAGIDVREVIYPGGDHFLFFSKRDEILANISAWLNEAR